MTKPTLTIHDLQALRRVLRHIATSDATIQNETLRLDGLLAAVISHNSKPVSRPD